MELTAKVLKVWSEVKATYKPKVKASQRPKVNSSKDAYDILKLALEQNMDYCEVFAVIMLNRGNKVLGVNIVSIGGIDSTVVDPRKIFQVALLANASNLILCHNHPSGNMFPSEEDIRLTEKIKAAGVFLHIKVLDHLIVGGEDKYYSFADEGRM